MGEEILEATPALSLLYQTIATNYNFPIGCIKDIEMEETSAICFDLLPQSQSGSNTYVVEDDSLTQHSLEELDAEADQCL